MLYQEIINNAVEQVMNKAEKIANHVLQTHKEENNPQLNSETDYGIYILTGIAGTIVIVATVMYFKKHNIEKHIQTSSIEYNNIPMQDITSKNSEEVLTIGEQSALI